jgi:aspartate/methionine/tyrosine aminotransferase
MIASPFKIERYFARYEFSAPHLLSCSDCEPLKKSELLHLADEELHTRWESLWIGYTDSQGEPYLRHEITKLYTKLQSEQVMVVVPIEGIFLTMHTLLQKDDHCIVTFPGYQSLYEVARSLGCQVSYWEPDEEKGWYFDIAKLKSLLKDTTKLIVINFPHNPTGAMLTTEQLNELVALARSRSISIFSDEMYLKLEADQNKKVASVADLYEYGIALAGMSKSFSLPGLRIGWLASQNKQFIESAMMLKDYTTICSSAPSQVLAAMGLRSKEIILGNNRRLIADNVRILNTWIEKHKELFSWVAPQGGSVGFVRYAGKEGVYALAQRLLAQEGLMILPSTVFDYGDAHWRIGLGRKNVPELLERLSNAL